MVQLMQAHIGQHLGAPLHRILGIHKEIPVASALKQKVYNITKPHLLKCNRRIHLHIVILYVRVIAPQHHNAPAFLNVDFVKRVEDFFCVGSGCGEFGLVAYEMDRE
jgi:hypothetical protein